MERVGRENERKAGWTVRPADEAVCALAAWGLKDTTAEDGIRD